jgi:hypothetical protein
MENFTLKAADKKRTRMMVYLGETRVGTVYLTPKGWIALGGFVLSNANGNKWDDYYETATEAGEALASAVYKRLERRNRSPYLPGNQHAAATATHNKAHIDR